MARETFFPLRCPVHPLSAMRFLATYQTIPGGDTGNHRRTRQPRPEPHKEMGLLDRAIQTGPT